LARSVLDTVAMFDTLRVLSSALFAAALLVGCAHSDPISVGDGPDDGTDPANEQQVCILHNCTEDAHCGGCSDGRNTCLVAEHRCVACDSNTGTGCPDGQECSSWGNCVPLGLECTTDDHGVPQITCGSNADCAACDPMHQICDPTNHHCVACTDGDTSACQATDLCVANQCLASCPGTCATDADCGGCDGAGFEAHACNAHQCAECSPTHACPGGQICSANGTCEAKCGTDAKGTCTTDADCGGCAGDNTVCHAPVNGGAGKCGPAAAGCSDLGQGVAILPAPFDQVTNTCSNDGDCSGVGIQFNIGKELRDLTGFDFIDDANIDYGMNVCASVGIGNTSCGVCVPCQEDSDCAPIEIDSIAGDLFGGVGSLVVDFLLDQLFGPNDHQVNMYCQAVAGGYGVCAPCPGLIYECGTSGGTGTGTGGGGGGTGTCSHDECTAGGPLNGSCGSCEADLCDYDAYCCTTAWDDLCVSEVADVCGANTCTGGGGGGGGGSTPPTCHDECSSGGALDPACNGCVEAICDYDPYCCDTAWDATCVSHVDETCTPPC